MDDFTADDEVTFSVGVQQLSACPGVKEAMAMSANDPLSTILNYNVCIKATLSLVTGLRCCLHCPHCSEEKAFDYRSASRGSGGSTQYAVCGLRPCQNKFGRNGRIFGGTHGLADGLTGATEHQGSDMPHFHGIISFATPYRSKTLLDIKEMIQKEILSPSSIKRYVEHMCREDHYDVDKHRSDTPQLEKDWAQLHGGRPHQRLSFNAAFLQDPAAKKRRATLWEAEGAPEPKLRKVATKEGLTYKANFEATAQEVFSRAQHHWHDLTEDGRRVPQPYCRDKGAQKKKKAAKKRHRRDDVCKQDFPRKLNLVGPMVICAGIARKYGYKCKGRRNVLSLILSRRQCHWLNGTTGAFAVAFRSNTDIKPNYRIPLTAATHEPDCEYDCLGTQSKNDSSARRLCIVAARAMKQMTGYFCGYTCKRQPVGRFQMKTARRMLPKLTAKLALMNSSSQKAHLVNKLYNILEGRGKLRTGAEEFNLAANARRADESFAEFFSTYVPWFLNCNELLARLEKETAANDASESRQMQFKKRPRDRDTVFYNFPEMYGYRPPEERLLYLSPFEFLMWWEPCSLQAPPMPWDADKQAAKGQDVYRLTKWILSVADLAVRGSDPNFKPIAGEDYEVDAAYIHTQWAVQDRTRYAVYPDDDTVKGLRRFRSQWFLRRRLRPVVPSPKGPMPHRGVDSRERRGMLCSLYFRPWVLLRKQSSAHVPHLANLNLVLSTRWNTEQQTTSATVPRRKCRGKQSILGKTVPVRDWDWRQRSYDEAWRRYLRGNVVSEHSARLIRNFLQIMAGTGKHNDEEELDGTSQRRRQDFGDAGRRCTVQDVHDLLKPEEAKKKRKAGDDDGDAKAKNYISERVERDFEMVERLDVLVQKASATRSLTSATTPAIEHNRPLPVASPPAAAKKAAAAGKKKKPAIYTYNYRQAYATWKQDLDTAVKTPTQEQWALLHAVHERCKLEHAEEVADTVSRTEEEPLRHFVHGLPGAGKTQVMRWLAAYFKQVWGWEADVHFVFLAPMNTMAARLDGHTVHSWGEIEWQTDGPGGGSRVGGGKKRAGDMSSMGAKTELLRFALIDEIEATGASALGQLQEHTAEATRRELYKYKQGSKTGRPRPFGGLNMLTFGDLWQLPPPQQISICSNPDRPTAQLDHRAKDILDMLWRPTREWGFNGFHNFSVSKRLDAQREDAAWFREVIDECRQGELHEEYYNFMHGYPTVVTGSWLHSTGLPTCGLDACKEQCTRLTLFPKVSTDARPAAAECQGCTNFRLARKLVIDDSTTELPAHIASARLITPYNRPRYYAAQHRALLFAKTQRTQLLWVQCEDFPLEGQAVTTLNDWELAQRRRSWMRKSDDRTGGVMGFMPLAKDLPMSFTRQLDKRRKILKHTQVTVDGWTLDPRDEDRVRRATEPEIMLEFMPLKLYVRKRGGDAMPQHLDLPPQIYGVSPMGSNWPLDPPAKTLWVRRFGFPLRPDFASTVHAVTGDELPAAIANLGHRTNAPNLEDALQGYIAISRVSGHQDLRIAQPFPRRLFNMGRLEIAHCMLEVLESHCKALRGAGAAMTADDLAARLETIERNKRQHQNKLSDQAWPCYCCGESFTYVHYIDDLKADDADLNDKILACIEKPGSLRVCKACKMNNPGAGSANMPSQAQRGGEAKAAVNLVRPQRLVCSKKKCGEVLPLQCFLDLAEERICVKCSGDESSWTFTCGGVCGALRNVKFFDRLKLCSQLLTLQAPLQGWDPQLPCLQCDTDAWKKWKGQIFTCTQCGLRPFEHFLIEQQKKITDRDYKDNICEKCLKPECSKSGCTNRSPKALYRLKERECFTCEACQEEQKHTCSVCKDKLALEEFPEEIQQRFKTAPGKKREARRCLACSSCAQCGCAAPREITLDENRKWYWRTEEVRCIRRLALLAVSHLTIGGCCYDAHSPPPLHNKWKQRTK
jgi:hypothetical protein